MVLDPGYRLSNIRW